MTSLLQQQVMAMMRKQRASVVPNTRRASPHLSEGEKYAKRDWQRSKVNYDIRLLQRFRRVRLSEGCFLRWIYSGHLPTFQFPWIFARVNLIWIWATQQYISLYVQMVWTDAMHLRKSLTFIGSLSSSCLLCASHTHFHTIRGQCHRNVANLGVWSRYKSTNFCVFSSKWTTRSSSSTSPV